MTMPTAQKKTPWQLYAILAVTLIPLIAAYVAYYTGIGVPDESVNEGTMLTPAPTMADLKGLEGEVPEFGTDRVWRLLVPIPEVCGESCEQNLYITRQVHTRLGAKAERVDRYAVNLAGEAGDSYLQAIAADHPDLKTMTAPLPQWQQWLRDIDAELDLNARHYYLLVDPQGFAMMAYTSEHTGNQLLTDIKRILRYSPEE